MKTPYPMNVIEPCCYNKQLSELIERIEGRTNVAHFFSFSDWDLSVLLPFFAARTPGGEVTVCMMHLQPETLKAIQNLMKRVYIDRDTKEERKLVSHLTLIVAPTDVDEKAQLYNFLGGCERLTLCEDRIGFRTLTMSNGERSFVVQGSINQGKSDYTQMYTVTTGKALYDEAMELISAKSRVKAIKGWAERYKEAINRQWSVMHYES